MSIDISDVETKLRALSKELTPREMRIFEYRVFKSVGASVKTVIKKDVTKHYNILQRVVAADIKYPRMLRSANMDIGCCIPIEGQRHIIGGNTFKAEGGTRGFKDIRAGKRYKITTKIVKGKTSTLPEVMENQGGHPPFRNIDAKHLNDATFTRAKRAGLPPKPNNMPIYRVTGLAVPQMPMNLAEKDVQEDIVNRLMDKIEKEYDKLMKKRVGEDGRNGG